MDNVVILLGEENSGKSSTIKKLFDFSNRKVIHHKEIDGKLFWIYGHGSPQELCTFCEVEEVKDMIKKRICRCKQEQCKLGSENRDIHIIIPFTIKKKNGILNVKCILKPIEWLRNEGYSVKIIYLEKRNKLLDNLIRDVSPQYTIISNDGDESTQSEKLKALLR